jgi:hypothetical protein
MAPAGATTVTAGSIAFAGRAGHGRVTGSRQGRPT